VGWAGDSVMEIGANPNCHSRALRAVEHPEVATGPVTDSR